MITTQTMTTKNNYDVHESLRGKSRWRKQEQEIFHANILLALVTVTLSTIFLFFIVMNMHVVTETKKDATMIEVQDKNWALEECKKLIHPDVIDLCN